MIQKIRVKDGKDGAASEKFILLNDDMIVTIEQKEDNLFQIFLVDGRILYMTLEMFTEHFDEEEELYT
jgi:hypothetical protein